MRFSDNRLQTFKAHFHEQLSKKGLQKREIDSMFSILCSERLGFEAHRLHINPDRRISESEMLRLIQDLKALKAHTPIQHVVGSADFRCLKFSVNEHVLIPRQETEELVDWIVKEEKVPAINIVDIGTGSGCIAICLALELNKSRVQAIDISPAALEVAKANAKKLNTDVNFIQADILQADLDLSIVDVIVSNPPYVLQSESEIMHSRVLEHDPHLALFVADDTPLLFYSAIAGHAKRILRPGGRLYFEINETKGPATIDLLRGHEFSQIDCRKDLNGKDRMIRAVL